SCSLPFNFAVGVMERVGRGRKFYETNAQHPSMLSNYRQSSILKNKTAGLLRARLLLSFE
ncbi:MAG: hypothetical protein WCD79_10530, partial [Chthoniobacteraceae bacterium]